MTGWIWPATTTRLISLPGSGRCVAGIRWQALVACVILLLPGIIQTSKCPQYCKCIWRQEDFLLSYRLNSSLQNEYTLLVKLLALPFLPISKGKKRTFVFFRVKFLTPPLLRRIRSKWRNREMEPLSAHAYKISLAMAIYVQYISQLLSIFLSIYNSLSLYFSLFLKGNR